MLGTGNGAELRQPLGYTIVGGLLVSQLLTPIRRQLSTCISTSSQVR